MENIETQDTQDPSVWDVNDDSKVNTVGKCPFLNGELNKSAGGGTRNRDWWPNQLRLDILRQHSSPVRSDGRDV